MTDTELLHQFVRGFEKFSELSCHEAIPPELDDGMGGSQWARPKWKPAAMATDPTALGNVYESLPGRFPPLFEQLVLSYRWLEIELGGFVELFANPPGPSFVPLLSKITADRVLAKVLFSHGLIQFGRAPDGNYDPVCFDTRRRRDDGDTPIVRLEHEAILCSDRLGESWEVAPAFRSLVESVVAKATDS
jgi:hypothetical protein